MRSLLERRPAAATVRAGGITVRHLLLSLCLLAPLAADELRFVYHLDERDLKEAPGPAADLAIWDESVSYEIGAFNGLPTVWGFSVINQRAEAAGTGWNLDYDSWALRTYGGRRIGGRSFALELTLFTGIGIGEGDFGGVIEESESGTLFEYGLAATLGMRINPSLTLGAGTTYEWSRTSLSFGDIRQDGWVYQGWLALSF
jgi:hypothetical protein